MGTNRPECCLGREVESECLYNCRTASLRADTLLKPRRRTRADEMEPRAIRWYLGERK